MDQEALRRFIRRKLQDGRLPRDGIRRVWSSPSDGETCDACDTVSTVLLLQPLHFGQNVAASLTTLALRAVVVQLRVLGQGRLQRAHEHRALLG
jgi:hypothetical protein